VSWRMTAGALWLALALILGTLFWWLMPACGLSVGGLLGFTFCSGPMVAMGPAPGLGAAIAREAVLRRQVHELELALLQRPACAAPSPPEDLPEDRWQERDLTMLEGCWTLETPNFTTQDVKTGEVSDVKSWEMCFDRDGRGQEELGYADGRSCKSALTAAFAPDGKLVIREPANVDCGGGNYLYRSNYACLRVDAAHAQCEGHQPEIDRRYQVGFRRRAA
jgi:hypothetical protein